MDGFLRYVTRILQGRVLCQQGEAASLVVASRLSDAIAATSSPLNLPYVHRERRRQLRLIEAELQRAQADLARDRQQLTTRKTQLVEQARALGDRFTALGVLQERMMASHPAQVAALSELSFLSSLKLRLRRRKMVEQLLDVYPLDPVPLNRRDPRVAMDPSAGEEYMIRGIRLPSTHQYQYEEQAATGFSYVCHLLLLVASLYSVSIRYRLVYRSSRSYVWDDIVTGTMFPLFWKGVERERFETAVSLLNKNIDHVRATILSRGEGYTMPALTAPLPMGGEGGGGGGEGTTGGTPGEGGANRKGEHQTLDNLKALLDILLPNDES